MIEGRPKKSLTPHGHSTIPLQPARQMYALENVVPHFSGRSASLTAKDPAKSNGNSLPKFVFNVRLTGSLSLCNECEIKRLSDGY